MTSRREDIQHFRLELEFGGNNGEQDCTERNRYNWTQMLRTHINSCHVPVHDACCPSLTRAIPIWIPFLNPMQCEWSGWRCCTFVWTWRQRALVLSKVSRLERWLIKNNLCSVQAQFCPQQQYFLCGWKARVFRREYRSGRGGDSISPYGGCEARLQGLHFKACHRRWFKAQCQQEPHLGKSSVSPAWTH